MIPDKPQRDIETLETPAQYTPRQIALAMCVAYALNSKRFVLVEPPKG